MNAIVLSEMDHMTEALIEALVNENMETARHMLVHCIAIAYG